MAVKLTLYAPHPGPIPLDELYELLGHDDVDAHDETLPDGTARLAALHIRWPDVSVMLDFVPAADIPAQRTLQLDAANSLLAGRDDRHAQKLLRRIEGTEQAVNVTVAPDWDAEGKAEALLRGVLAYHERAFFYADSAFYNERGKRLLGPEDSKGKYFARPDADEDEDVSSEAAARKAKSLEALKREKVPYIKHLPVIADENAVTLRSQDAVAKRALALYCIAHRAEGETLKQYNKRLRDLKAEDAATPDERAYAEMENPPEYLTIKFSQRWESLWVLLWSLEFIKKLNRPDDFCDVQRVARAIEERGPDSFMLDAMLRPASEILDALDLIYRYDWAVLDAELYGRKPPAKLVPVVVYERHYALKWLIQYRGQDWDHITTDT
jgi:hypothetical protein